MPFILLKFKNDKEEQEIMLLLEDTLYYFVQINYVKGQIVDLLTTKLQTSLILLQSLIKKAGRIILKTNNTEHEIYVWCA